MILVLVRQQRPKRRNAKMAAMKKPGSSTKSKPRLKSAMKKKATKKTTKKK
jgi:hypothetical protein